MKSVPQKIKTIPNHKIPGHVLGLIKNPLKAISNMIARHGDIFALQLNKEKIVFLNHPDYVKHILKDNQTNYSRGRAVKQSAVTGLHKMLGNGIFMSDGEDWEAQHKLLKALFSVTAIESTLPIIEDELAKLIATWKKAITHQPTVEVETDLNLLMLRIMLRTQICNEILIDEQVIFEALTGRMKHSSVKALFLFQLKAFALKPFGVKYAYSKHEQYLQTLQSIADGLVDGLIAGSYTPSGLFKVLLEDYRLGKTTRQDIIDQFMNFVFAAFDTTATAITWTLYNLSSIPNLQAKAKAELNESIQADPDTHIANRTLPLMQLIIKETLRLYPPVWSYAREAAQDDVMCGYAIPAKTIVVISSYALHRHPSFWPSGAGFDLSNFEKDNFKGKNFAYIPFGQGKRMCIGRALGEYQIQIIVCTLLQHFQFNTVNDEHPEINANIIIKGKTPIQLKLSAI